MSVQLFVRTTRTLSLTEAGELYYQRSKDIVERMEATQAELMEFQGQPSGKITLSWPNGLAYSSVSRVLGTFAAENPKIRLDVRASTDMVNLIEDKIDFAFRVSELDDSNLIAIKLENIYPMICASPEFIARHGSPRSIEALFEVPNLIPTFMNFPQKARKISALGHTLDMNEHHKVDDIASLYNLAKQGLGAALLMKHIAEDDLKAGALINLTEQAPLPPVPLYLVYPKLDFQPRKIRAFIDHFKKAYAI